MMTFKNKKRELLYFLAYLRKRWINSYYIAVSTLGKSLIMNDTQNCIVADETGDRCYYLV